MWQSRVEILLRISTMLMRSKRCSAELPLRVGLICIALMHGYLISLRSAFDAPPLTGVLRYRDLNTVMRSKYAMK